MRAGPCAKHEVATKTNTIARRMTFMRRAYYD
jgi:hypothetical protein